jgi:hypothetical protein
LDLIKNLQYTLDPSVRYAIEDIIIVGSMSYFITI